jgi:Fe-S cluster assembly protein SufD
MIRLNEIDLPLSVGAPAWLVKLRHHALDRFVALRFPTTHDEDWKYTNVSALAKTRFEPGQMVDAEPDRFPLADMGCATRLVFVNGNFSRDLSSTDHAQRGVRVHSLRELLLSGSETVESHFARYARLDNQAFVALNTAMAEDGAVVEVDKDAVLDQPIHLLFLSVPNGGSTVSYPRNLIVAGRGSEASVIESYVGADGAACFTNAVTEIRVGDGALLDHYRIQQESDQAFHVATVQAIQGRQSVFSSHNVALGAALARNDVNSVLDAEGAECFLNGLFFAAGAQHVDNHTMLDHAKPHCQSRELYKGILAGRGVGVFNGKTVVRKDAQKTNAIQSNRNLLLSGDAVINTKPQLEILADDVRCTHGATVGQIDQEALFYMQSRGIPAGAARQLLIHAFAGEVLDLMKWQPAREKLAAELHGILSQVLEGGPA